MKHIYFLALLILCLLTIYALNFGRQETYTMYFYNETLDKELNNGTIACDSNAVVPVTRNLRRAPSLSKTMRLLIEEGPLPGEEILGFSSEFPHQGFRLIDIMYGDEGTLKLTFTEVPGFTSGGSCRVNLLRTQIEKTALQFEGVTKVEILPEDILQP